MEFQFDKTVLDCLQTLTRQLQTQELTQDVKIPEGFPDIGRILGCWGQVLLRGKEWRNGNMGASGGVTAWVLYLPDGGGEPCCVQSWLPFQMKWDIPDTRYDGTILLQPILRGADARSLGARKMMVRVDLGVMAEAVIPAETELYTPMEIPEDVQLLRKTYPLTVPREAGEKVFTIEEDLVVPASAPQPESIVRYCIKPELIDQKVLADKVIFRGAALLHMLYRSEDGKLHTWDFEIPFSQYAQLDREYGEDGTVRVMPVVTELELSPKEGGGILMKAGLAGQYIIYERPNVELVEDAYSPSRQVDIITRQLDLPALLDARMETLQAEAKAQTGASETVDLAFYPEAPRMVAEDGGYTADLAGQFQLIYYDENGELQNALTPWEGQWRMEEDRDADVQLSSWISGTPQAMLSGDGVSMRADMLLDATAKATQGMQMVTGLELGEKIQPAQERPSLILRRAEEDGLWQIAKQTGSTVDSIMKANGLDQEPPRGKMLLIPIS